MKIFILIPAYNEAPVIGEVIKGIKKQGYKNIVVVDDGSTDQTYQVCRNAKVIILRHILNRGKGAAIKTGLNYLKSFYPDIIVTIDGDGQHNSNEINKVIEKINQDYDIVLGSRFKQDNNIPFLRRLGNCISNYLTFFAYGLYVTDSQSGFRAYSKKAINLIDIENDRYEYDSEIIREIVKNKLKYIEIPIKVNYTKYSMSKHNKQNVINGLKTALKIIGF